MNGIEALRAAQSQAAPIVKKTARKITPKLNSPQLGPLPEEKFIRSTQEQSMNPMQNLANARWNAIKGLLGFQ